jgi:DNA-binding transcriptional LysR family regulator
VLIGRAVELRQLTYFVAVAREESFTRAAQSLYVAQPGVSQQIRRLEAELGQQLFDRSTKPTRLTAAGHAFLPHARGALRATEAGRAALAQLQGVVAGRLSLGTIPGIPHIDLAGLLVTFHDAHPRVEVTLREEHPIPLLEHLRREDYDAAIVGLSHPDPPDGLRVEMLSVELLVLVTAPTHPLAARATVAVSQLRDESFVTLTRGSSLRRHLEDVCDAAGFPARIALETGDVELLSDLVARGLGVTIVPRAIADAGATRQALRIIDIHPPITRRYTALAWNSAGARPPAAATFLTYARDWLARPNRNPRLPNQSPHTNDQ